MLPETEGSSPKDVTAEGATGAPAPEPAPDPNAAPASETAEPDANSTPADPSTAAPEDANQGPQTPLEAVEAAMAAEEAAREGKSSDPEGQPKSEGDGADPEAKDGGEPAKAEGDGEGKSEDEPPPFHEHPRWKEMVGERDDLKARIEISEPKAEVYDRLVGTLDDAGISDEEFNTLVNIGVLMKTDPAAALREMMPYVENLQAFTGDALSPELQAAVDNGEITEDYARRVQAAESQQAFGQQRHETTEAERQAQAEDDHRRTLAVSADNWYADHERTDPDWPLKAPLVESYAARAFANGVPSDTAGVQAALDGALKDAEAHLKKIRPDVPQATPSVPDPGIAATQSRPQPKTPLEVTEMALSGG